MKAPGIPYRLRGRDYARAETPATMTGEGLLAAERLLTFSKTCMDVQYRTRIFETAIEHFFGEDAAALGNPMRSGGTLLRDNCAVDAKHHEMLCYCVPAPSISRATRAVPSAAFAKVLAT